MPHSLIDRRERSHLPGWVTLDATRPAGDAARATRDPRAMSEAEFILKATPPRLPATALDRARLLQAWAGVRERAAIAVVAPPGFGKTTLLMQWRRAWLEQDTRVAWLSVDKEDEPARFVLALLHAAARGFGGEAFATMAHRGVAEPRVELELLTGLLAEVAARGDEAVLVLDNAERLPEATVREALGYLLHNAPSNLRVVIASRAPLATQPWESATRGDYAALGAEQLRLRPEESLQILAARFGRRLDRDDGMRLHEATEGWPIGLQLAAATIEGSTDPSAAIATLSAREGSIERYFVELLFESLPEALADFQIGRAHV